jgi:asparagine synthase (glutamine-hydrolysing)
MFSNSDAMNLYLSLVGFSHYKSATNPESFEKISVNLKKKMKESTSSRDSYNYMRELDVASYLTDNILVKIDRSAMAFGLETRAPFLDKRVANLASTANKKWLNHGEQKHALKVILSHYVSNEVFRRPKMGFGAPIGEWLRTSLNEWASELIFKFDWEAIGISKVYVIELWEKNEASKDASATYLWILLSLANSVNMYK